MGDGSVGRLLRSGLRSLAGTLLSLAAYLGVPLHAEGVLHEKIGCLAKDDAAVGRDGSAGRAG